MITIKKIGKAYNERMAEILASNPMITPNYDLLFDKGPDFFLAEQIWPIQLTYYGIFKNELLVGMGSHTAYSGYLDQKLVTFNHFGNYCVDANYQNQGLFNKLSSYMAKEIFTKDNLGFVQIIDGNKASERYFTVEDLPMEGMPKYKRQVTLITKTLILIKKRRRLAGFETRFASETDLSTIISFLKQEYPKRTMSFNFCEDWFLKKIDGTNGLSIKDYLLVFKSDTLVGLCGAWDMKTVKRTKIVRYKGTMKLCYHLLNLIFNLPKPGTYFKELYLTDLLVKNENSEVLKALLVGINNHFKTKGYLLVHFSSYKNSPVLSGSTSFFGFKVFSNVFFKSNDAATIASFETSNELCPYFDVSYM